MDGFLSSLGTVDVKAGAAIFFEDINLDLGVGVFGLVSSTLMELQTIALALKCVPSFRSVDLFSDSQAAVDACKSESLLVYPDFRNYCWIECHHIANVICHKNLEVIWIKVRGHLSISSNKCADALTKKTASSAWCLPHLVGKRFLKTGGTAVSGNSRRFVCDVFCSVHHVHWEVGSGFWVVTDGLCANVNWSKSSLVWHPNSYLAVGSTSLPVAVHKRLYDRRYSSVVYLYCGDVEISDHVFFCSHDATGRVQLLDIYASAWETLSGLSWSSSCVGVGTALYKGFFFNNWYHESVSVFKDSKVRANKIVDFVRGFCLAFQNDIWLVCTKHRAFMEKHSLISCDGSTPASVSGLSMVFSAGVVRLLGVAEAFGVGFGFRKFCPFFSSIGDLVSVRIDV
ncbi:hypothetical protein G9A89_023811 [Geosiphon pyriformis]|nr:hypothetical protein G9A89_023811 [Geosiphon pyriformis]